MAGNRGRWAATVLLAIGITGRATAGDVWTGGVVAADHETASRAGLEMLEAGGNAVDAAVATAFCLGVVRPYSCGIGGGGFLLLHLRGDAEGPREVAIDHRERAPGACGPDYYEGLEPEASLWGAHAAAVPGTPAGLLLALERYGVLDRAAALAPAIRAAEEGFEADAHYGKSAAEVIAWFEERPAWKERFPFVWKRFLREGKVREGDRIRLPEQAEALRLIARDGAAAFYDGPIAEAIVAAVRMGGGDLTREDLRRYEPVETKPLEGSFRGLRVLAMPPPSSGGTALLQTFGILEALERNPAAEKPGSAAYIHLVAEAEKHAFADRAAWMGDPEFVDVPLERLLAPDYLIALAARIDGRSHPPGEYGTPALLPEDGGTSHYCVVDRWGNAASGTETINLEFGSLIVVEPYGFCLNNEMDDFLTRRGVPNAYGLYHDDRNLPAPGKRPLSSMCPTILLDDDGPVALAGASGGPRIISATIQALLNVVLFDMDAEKAVSLPRFHHQWMPNDLYLERGIDSGVQLDLFGKGHHMERMEVIGQAQLIRRAGDGYEAASDPRKGGKPAGRNETAAAE
ncbi:MAG: gamma-glutamyltransferase [Candidatus Eisenbacteria bacterium]|nr:gamma-glutamyltransferase [Candidatus Eisenbacteria bacterium]